MINWVKRYIIPSKRNSYQPPFLIGKNTRKIIALILVIEAIFFIAPKFIPSFQPGAIIISLLGELTNKERQENQLATLTVNPVLSEAAELKAQDMATKGYFAHTSPEGKTPWYWIDLVGYKYDYAGENLAVNFTETENVTSAWMKSPTHKANIVKSAYTEMGSGMAVGTYKGRESVFVVQLYGNPRIEKGVVAVVSKGTENSERESTSTIIAQVLGASTSTVDIKLATNTLATDEDVVVPNSFQLIDDFVIPEGNPANMPLLIILGVAIVLLLLNIIIKISFVFQHLLRNALLLIIVVVGVWLININYITKANIFNSNVDYSKEQVSR